MRSSGRRFAWLGSPDVKIVSTRLGHARTAITQDTYQHVLDGLQEQAAERRAALLVHPTATRGASS
jgi:integrase